MKNSFSDCADAIRSYWSRAVLFLWSRAVLFLRHIRHVFISFHAYVCRLLSFTAKQQFTNMQIALKQDQRRNGLLACFFFLFCSFFYYLVFFGNYLLHGE